MRVIRNIFSQWHLYVLWALLSVLLWGWIFGFVTDTSPERKITLFADVYGCRDVELAVALEAEKPDGIRMVKVHPFTYAMFDENNLLSADLYIVRGSEAEAYLESFAPLEGIDDAAGTGYYARGQLYGLRVYDAAAGTGAAATYLTYAAPGAPAENYFLFFGANSPHLEDGTALAVAERLLALD